MDVPLTQVLERPQQLLLVKALWNRDAETEMLHLYRPYLIFYREETKALTMGFSEVNWELTKMAIQTHEQLISIAKVMSHYRENTLSVVIDKVKEQPGFKNADTVGVRKSIYLVARVWLTLNVWDDFSLRIISERPAITWQDGGKTITELALAGFSKTTQPPLPNSELPDNFTVAFMTNACGLKVVWTPYLTNHLKLKGKTRTLQLYYFKACLYDQMNGSPSSLLADNGIDKDGKDDKDDKEDDAAAAAAAAAATTGRSILPHNFLLETISTLNLLFPPDDQPSKDFLSDQRPPKTFWEEPPEDERRPLDLNDYPYWRERLVELRRIYFSQAQTVEQVYARKNLGERVDLFLVLVTGFGLAILFGLVSSVTAIYSAVLAKQALDLSRMQLQAPPPVCTCSLS